MFFVQFITLNACRFAEYITVKDVDDLIKVPDDLAMQLAATLPAGGLRSYSAVLHAKPFIEEKIAKSSG
jgi:D-arabinose 1-dehydrogenase-like Zn-dependent alcohol dehydrogenase